MNPNPTVKNHVFKELQQEANLFTKTFIQSYADKLGTWKKEMKRLFVEYKEKGYTIYGYGASGRANTILNYCMIELDGILDDADSKIGSYTPLINTYIALIECTLTQLIQSSLYWHGHMRRTSLTVMDNSWKVEAHLLYLYLLFKFTNIYKSINNVLST